MELTLLGKKVNYLRLDPEGKELRGEGIVHAVFINESKRVSVRVVDDSKVINCDLVAINATEEGAKKYFDHLTQVRSMADKANEENRAAVSKANDEIEALNIAYMGAPLEL